MKKISLLTVALIAGFAGVSKAEISQYASTHISYSKAKLEAKDHDGAYEEAINKAAPALSVAYGLNFGKGLRSDVEFTYAFDAKKTDTEVEEYEEDDVTKTEINKVKSSQMSLMLNGYYDIATGTKWTPYVNLGIGMTKQTLKYNGVKTYEGENVDEAETESGKLSDTTFTWQAGVGVSYEVANNMTIDAGYRYVDYGKMKDTESYEEDGDIEVDEFKAKTKANVLSIGARYAF